MQGIAIILFLPFQTSISPHGFLDYFIWNKFSFYSTVFLISGQPSITWEGKCFWALKPWWKLVKLNSITLAQRGYCNCWEESESNPGVGVKWLLGVRRPWESNSPWESNCSCGVKLLLGVKLPLAGSRCWFTPGASSLRRQVHSRSVPGPRNCSNLRRGDSISFYHVSQKDWENKSRFNLEQLK